jgi:hypothetical protein
MLKPSLNKYITSEFGGVEELKKEILGDFFRHGSSLPLFPLSPRIPSSEYLLLPPLPT